MGGPIVTRRIAELLGALGAAMLTAGVGMVVGALYGPFIGTGVGLGIGGVLLAVFALIVVDVRSSEGVHTGSRPGRG